MLLEQFMRIYACLSSVLNQASLTLLPPACILCGYPGRNANICLPCQKNLPILPHSCPRCGRFLSFYQELCGTCLSEPPPFDRTFALCAYEAPLVQMIIRLKFQQRLSHAHAFADLLTEKILGQWYQGGSLPELIIPMPLHPLRLRERGFNQALEIAKPVARRLNIPIAVKGIQRIRHTAAQSSLPAAQRRQNLASAFAVSGDYSGRHIAVVDDVITTGHTMREFCQTLKARGAERIDVWCCARRG